MWGWFDRVGFVIVCDWFHLLVWRMSCGFHCATACVWGFGCGSVMIAACSEIGCVWDSMLCGMWWVA